LPGPRTGATGDSSPSTFTNSRRCSAFRRSCNRLAPGRLRRPRIVRSRCSPNNGLPIGPTLEFAGALGPRRRRANRWVCQPSARSRVYWPARRDFALRSVFLTYITTLNPMRCCTRTSVRVALRPLAGRSQYPGGNCRPACFDGPADWSPCRASGAIHNGAPASVKGSRWNATFSPGWPDASSESLRLDLHSGLERLNSANVAIHHDGEMRLDCFATRLRNVLPSAGQRDCPLLALRPFEPVTRRARDWCRSLRL
jgi:hypothetical protein